VVDFRADIEQQLKPFTAYLSGDVFASLVAVKGKPGQAEREGAAPFGGSDGLALDKSFGRLGWGFGSQDTRTWLGVLLAPSGQAVLTAHKLRLLCEIVDPLVLVALDEQARLVLQDAFAHDEKSLAAAFAPGSVATALGRTLISVEGFEDALADADAKQKVWAQLKRCVFPPNPPTTPR
jgi:hypothetical protein